MKKILGFLLLIIITLPAVADEGMWLPQLLSKLNESRMKSLGMRITAEDIYSVNKGSLKDAVVSFGGFCTGEVISTKGLILTNHHCGYSAVQDHTTLENNYLRDGFWSKTMSEELKNPGLFVTFIKRIDDVTKQVMAGIDKDLIGPARQAAIAKNMKAANDAAVKTGAQESFVRGFFEDNQYYLFVTETYKDIRLVGAPPSSIGKYGNDTDNWVWPRHTGDFSVFRIYAGKGNMPAEYSVNNVPYVPVKSLNISLDGIAENDFTLVFGFPGRTQQYLPAIAVEQIRTQNDPAKIAIRDKALIAIDGFMRKDEQIKIQYASKYARIQNSYKKWQGEVLGLTRANAFAKKTDYENEFTKRVQAKPEWKEKYGEVLPSLNRLYEENLQYSVARDYYSEIFSKIELQKLALQLNSLVAAYDNGGVKGYESRLEKVIPAMQETIKDFSAPVDKAVFASLMSIYLNDANKSFAAPSIVAAMQKYDGNATKWVDDLYKANQFYDSASVRSLFLKDPADAVAAIRAFSAIDIFTDAGGVYQKQIQPTYNAKDAEIEKWQRIYMEGQMEVMTEKKFYPDANSTMRVAYGQVKPYEPRDGVKFDYKTDLKGVMEKYVPGDYEFDLPAKLVELYKKKDYGVYANKDGSMPVNFIATNHTTGGNSGSPVLDAYGNLIGLNFDRAWEGTMSDINYDPSICRNIMVDIRYVLFIIDKFADAKRLVEEMKMVHPKAKK